jgi:two-component system phosphate regulon sensor histidine kinase PhoR
LLQAGPWLLLGAALALWSFAAYAAARRLTRARLQQGRAQRRAQELEQELAALRTELEAERRMVDRFPEAVIVFGADRSVLRWNATAQNAFGRDMAALLRHPSFRAALERAQAQGTDQFAELSLPVPIARELQASVLALPADQAGPRLVAVLSDRTRDQAVERMRADFVANASHELRTPLTSLIGFIDTLRGPAADDPAAQTRFLGIMADQAHRMNRLIDDLLSLSRIELTEHLPPSGRVMVAALITRMGASFAPLLAARNTKLETELAADLPEIPGDETQLEQVLQNLLDNALKYGREGGTIRVLAQNGQNGVVIKVQDDGRGIPRALIPRLTERFYRVDAHRSRAVGGTGLGLAIVKHIVNRHRGQLAIDSNEGVGTTVQVWLPT